MKGFAKSLGPGRPFMGENLTCLDRGSGPWLTEWITNVRTSNGLTLTAASPDVLIKVVGVGVEREECKGRAGLEPTQPNWTS